MKFKIIGIVILCAFILLTSHTTVYASDNSNIKVTVLVEPESYCIVEFSDGLARFNKDGKYGFINKNGEVVLPFVYDDAEQFHDGRACVRKDDRVMFIDKYGTVIFVFEEEHYPGEAFHDGLVAVCNYRDGVELYIKYGYADENGEIVIPLIYDDAGDFNGGIAWVSKDGKYGCIDKTGKIVIPFIYDSAGDFNDGIAWASKDDKYGCIDKTGKIIVPFIYNNAIIYDSEGLARVNGNDGKCGYINKNGNVVIPLIYYDAWGFNDEMVWLSKETEDGLIYGFANISGEIVLPFVYGNAWDFSDGLACVNKDGKWQYIDKTGAVIISLPANTYSTRGCFHEGFARMEKFGEGFGYIDKTGKVVIPFIYDYAWDFSEGLAVVQKDGKCGYIDTLGNVIVPLIYDDAEAFKDGLAIIEKEKKYGLLKMSYDEDKTAPIAPQTGDKNITFYVILSICAVICMKITIKVKFND